MKILFHRYGSIVEPDILEAFAQLNIEVIRDELEMEKKVIDPDLRISSLAELILENSPDIVFSINYFPYISQVCEKLNIIYAALSVDCPVLEILSTTIRNRCNRLFLFDRAQYESVVNENPECIFYLPLASNVSRWDGIVVPRDGVSRPFYKYNVSLVGSLYTEKSPIRQAALSEYDRGYFEGVLKGAGEFTDLSLVEEVLSSNPELSQKLKASLPEYWERCNIGETVTDTDDYISTMQVLGAELTAMDRMKLLNAIASIPYSEELIGDHGRYAKDADRSVFSLFTRSDTTGLSKAVSVHGGVSTHEEMPRVFKCSKINLNPTMRCIKTGLPQRIWDIMGCGGLLLTNFRSEIPDYFEIGEDLLCYETEKDCIELISYFLSHDDEREAIALSGYNKVKNLHTYVIRVAQMLSVIYPE
ncbi:MAG: glycosyltransferase [Lachnospiraceae bacterium]|nr:glycosyltransferase [Lachnospiraceae bacterium]